MRDDCCEPKKEGEPTEDIEDKKEDKEEKEG